MTHVLDAEGRIKEYWGEVALVDLADYAQGSLIYGGAADWQDLAHPGVVNRVLQSTAADVGWSASAVTFPVAGAVPVGTGVASQVAYWTGASVLAGDAGLTYNPATGTLSLANSLTFTGATGVNDITVPDNLADALHLSDVGGIEYMRIVSANAQPVVVFNEGGVDVDFRVGAVGFPKALVVWGSEVGLVGVGGKAGGTLPNYLSVFGNRAVNPAVSTDGLCIYAGYTGGTTGTNRGAYLAATIADVGAGDYNVIEGFSGEVYAGLLLNDGAASTVVAWTGSLTVATGVRGFVGNISSGAGVILGACGGTFGVSNIGASSRIRTAYGIYVDAVQAMGTDAGQAHIAYGIYIADALTASGGATNKAWAIYSAATEDSYLAGKLGLGTTPDTRLDIGAGAIELNEMAAPGAGAASTCRFYLVDNAGKSELYAIFQTGAAQLVAAEP